MTIFNAAPLPASRVLTLTLAGLLLTSCALAQEVCTGFGPQTPRDIDRKAGQNPQLFSLAPHYSDMNFCDLHFHNNAEHKAKAFAIYAGERDGGKGGGYQCGISKRLSAAELKKPAADTCKGLVPGDTVEFHWVYSSCDVAPAHGLGSCLSDSCANPNLRVETQVFTLVNDSKALQFDRFDYAGPSAGSYHQTRSLPTSTGEPIEFLGSTTGPSYSEQTCSPIQASWSVRPNCAKLDINSLARWCEDNVFEEDHAHGVRQLVTHPALLSEIP